MVDQDSALLKVLSEAEVNLLDTQYAIKKAVRINFDTCPVGGHYYHGLVERKIRTVQEIMARHEFTSSRLTATGLQSLMKLIESDMNSLPLGYSYDQKSSNTPLLKMISPMMLRIGRMTSRNLQGPVTVPSGPKEMMQKVSDLYELWYQVYNDSYVMKTLMDRVPKWFKHDRDLCAGDIVFFRKTEGPLGGGWSLGEIDTVVKSRDNLVRRATIRYVNPGEVGEDGKYSVARLTDRAVRSLVRLFNVEDTTWREEMKVVEDLVNLLDNLAPRADDEAMVTKPKKCDHCCLAHCRVLGHYGRQDNPSFTVTPNHFELNDFCLADTSDEEREDEMLDLVFGSSQDSFLGNLGILGKDIAV